MTIDYKGATIFYKDQGSGSPIVLLHGFLENSAMWDVFLPALVKNHRVICIDLLGHGETDALGYLHTMETMAQAVQAVVESLQLKNITIIGHSMGGYVGCAFAKAYPENIEKLCLLNSTPLPDDAERILLRKRANKMAQTQYEQLIRMSFVNLFDADAKTQNKVAIKWALGHALRTPLQGYMAANEGMAMREDNTTFWKTTKIITGMILGSTDWIIDASSHEQRFASESTFFEIIAGGHMLHISNPKETLKALLKFIQL